MHDDLETKLHSNLLDQESSTERILSTVLESNTTEDWLHTSTVTRFYCGKKKEIQELRHRRGWRKHAKWEDCFVTIYGESWRATVKSSPSKPAWNKSWPDFAYNLLSQYALGGRALRKQYEKKFEYDREQQRAKKPRVVFEDMVIPVETFLHPRHTTISLDIRGDSETCIQWFNGEARVKGKSFLRRVQTLQNIIFELWRHERIFPLSSARSWARHIFRELNTQADAICNDVMVRGIQRYSETDVDAFPSFSEALTLRISFDGGFRAPGIAAAGWSAEIWEQGAWHRWRQEGALIKSAENSLDAELTALEAVVDAIIEVVNFTRPRSEPPLSLGASTTPNTP